MTNHRAAKDFDKKTVKTLNSMGVFFVGSTYVPGADIYGAMSYSNGETAYELNNNGQGQVRLYREVLAMAVLS